jgi:hypothetical protein
MKQCGGVSEGVYHGWHLSDEISIRNMKAETRNIVNNVIEMK